MFLGVNIPKMSQVQLLNSQNAPYLKKAKKRPPPWPIWGWLVHLIGPSGWSNHSHFYKMGWLGHLEGLSSLTTYKCFFSFSFLFSFQFVFFKKNGGIKDFSTSKNTRATQVGLFSPKKMKIINGVIKLKISETWLGYFANF